VIEPLPRLIHGATLKIESRKRIQGLACQNRIAYVRRDNEALLAERDGCVALPPTMANYCKPPLRF
jgi:hypothetical protein